MTDRATLKEFGKRAFQQNYWRCVAVALILMLLAGGSGSSSNTRTEDNSNTNSHYLVEIGGGEDTYFTNRISIGRWPFVVIRSLTITTALVIAGIVLIFLSLALNVLTVGGCKFFLENAMQREDPAGVGLLFYGFQNGRFWHNVLTLFLRGLFTLLWTLLFLIPGIIKTYEYRLIPYLLAEYPDMEWQEVFRRSKELMDGHKMDAFVLDLSFIGWHLLGGISFGLVDIFYTNPYQNAVNAEFYMDLCR